MEQVYRFARGTAPILVSMPHVGTEVPGEIAARFTEEARVLPDTDWHVDRLYDFLDDLGATVLAAKYSRYVIDLNRPPDGRPLYPGASETALCPTTTFDEQPVYIEGQEPDEAETEIRRQRYWEPYHSRIQAELSQIRAEHGIAILWEAHSIRSRVPRFFDNVLPDLNLGTAGGESASPDLASRLAAVAAGAKAYTDVLDGRFRGGFITRNYGRPNSNIHAVQLELSQATYMDEGPPFTFREDLAEKIRPVLRDLVETAIGWARPSGQNR